MKHSSTSRQVRRIQAGSEKTFAKVQRYKPQVEVPEEPE